ncbi:MAG: GNVR domain-containing protein, partial [Acidobacteriota bacterium]
KAITDDALWDKFGNDSSGAVSKDLEVLRLHTQELNPVYSRLGQRLANAQVNYEKLIPQESYLDQEIADLRSRIAELNRLLENQETAFRTAERRRSTGLASLRREREFRTGELKRDVASLQRTFKTLSQNYESARLAMAEESSEVQIGMPASANDRPVKPKVGLIIAIALAVGLMLSVGLSFLLEYLQHAQTKLAPPGRLYGSQLGPK